MLIIHLKITSFDNGKDGEIYQDFMGPMTEDEAKTTIANAIDYYKRTSQYEEISPTKFKCGKFLQYVNEYTILVAVERTVDGVTEAIESIEMDDRVKVANNFCKGCWSKDPLCYCQRDD